ncbi:MAG: hypothetical protein AVDCRST_MAG67-2319, partial [uncultured Solirubrobacteraceae bacterium]
ERDLHLPHARAEAADRRPLLHRVVGRAIATRAGAGERRGRRLQAAAQPAPAPPPSAPGTPAQPAPRAARHAAARPAAARAHGRRARAPRRAL